MKQTKGFQIGQIIYPVGLYYVVSSLCYFALEILLGSADETYMLRQLVGDAVTIPVILKFYMVYQNIRDTVYGKKKFRFSSEQAINIAVTVVSVAALGIAVNNIIAMTSLIQASEGFQTANQAFFAGAAVYEFLGSCFLIPIAEELLFRGVVYQRLKLMLGVAPAIICSALIFGLVHANLVQFLYAAVLGCLLAFLYEKTGFFYVPVLGHIAANTVSVVREETGCGKVRPPQQQNRRSGADDEHQPSHGGRPLLRHVPGGADLLDGLPGLHAPQQGDEPLPAQGGRRKGHHKADYNP